MMGRREHGQGQFFYEFTLDEVVPPDHLVRRIDAVLDLGWVHKDLAPYQEYVKARGLRWRPTTPTPADRRLIRCS